MLPMSHIVSPVYTRKDVGFGSFCVDVVFDYKIVPPLTRQEILLNEVLGRFLPFKGAMGTNFPISDISFVAELEKLVAAAWFRFRQARPYFQI
jgi:hypothetical protein